MIIKLLLLACGGGLLLGCGGGDDTGSTPTGTSGSSTGSTTSGGTTGGITGGTTTGGTTGSTGGTSGSTTGGGTTTGGSTTGGSTTGGSTGSTGGTTPTDGCDTAPITADGVSYPTIQDAIDAGPKAEIIICPGTYVETLTIRGDVALVGTKGETIIDGGGPVPSASTIKILGGAVSLTGLTITGGTGTQNDGSTWGGGIYSASDGVVIEDCLITGNTADIGGGMVGTARYPGQDVLRDSVFEANTANMGGGGFLLFHAVLEAVEVTGNSAPFGGGGTAWYWDTVADADTRIHDNTAESGGGLYLWDDGIWAGGEVSSNVATGAGGGGCAADDCELSDVVIADNSSGAEGGGISLSDGGRMTASGLSVLRNTAATDGGGISVRFSTLDCTDCDLGGTADDNSPDDVTAEFRAGTSSYQGEAGETFSCSEALGGCDGL